MPAITGNLQCLQPHHGKRSPTRYFARTVVIKFRELGWWNPVVP
jgi:hypothetical protein